jgi:hypothetical protein
MNPNLLLAQIATNVDGDIRDIRGPVPVPSSWEWLVLLLSILAVAALAWGGWLLWQRRRKPEAPPDPLTIALDALQAARSLLQPETAREFSIAVSQAVRGYIEARFRVAASHKTTEEFLHDLTARADSPLASHRSLLDDFLRHCDLAKFGRWALSAPEMEAMWQSARTFLSDTRPQDDEKAEEAKKA